MGHPDTRCFRPVGAITLIACPSGISLFLIGTRPWIGQWVSQRDFRLFFFQALGSWCGLTPLVYFRWSGAFGLCFLKFMSVAGSAPAPDWGKVLVFCGDLQFDYDED